MDELEGLGVAGEVEAGAQDLVAGGEGVRGLLEGVGVEGPVVADPEGVDVVVDRPFGVEVHFDEHAELDL